ncbi:uncharacterized protein MAM_04413 [Metarhizium album ARSEF 1941]|uniref:Luciferase domain-containing protein n=1 Tax=Metarhizium album (strain ARSEF 1941) TaxID=1081103 RepID=A0A0B2WWN3_METAS|nr:uncharacterized protein MAM_04413 [Metarhizium album ARSEF 1941]KHN98024.1 hypothetical protein MAM_04413 [Metarhizium album ARSEF 1941]
MSSAVTTSVVAALAVACASLLIAAYRDYRAYIAFGPHGLPDNFRGWCTQLLLSRVSRKDTTVPAPYDMEVVKKSCGPNASTSYLARPLAARRGPRPEIPGFTAPQRQVTATASSDMKLQMDAYLRSLTRANDETIQFELSVLEGPVPAVQLKKGLERPHYLDKTKGEMIHVHPPDGSTHLLLSLADSKAVIETGWGQRHRLSGSLLGWGYTLIYAPRSQADFETWKDMVCASVGYCCAEISAIQSPLSGG